MTELEALKASLGELPPGVRLLREQVFAEDNRDPHFEVVWEDEFTKKTVTVKGSNYEGSWVKPYDGWGLVSIVWEEFAFLRASSLRAQGKPAPTHEEVWAWMKGASPRCRLTSEVRKYIQEMEGGNKSDADGSGAV